MIKREPTEYEIEGFLARPNLIIAYDMSTDNYFLFDPEQKELWTISSQLVHDLNIGNLIHGKYRQSRASYHSRSLAGAGCRPTTYHTGSAPTFCPEAIAIGARERESYREGELAARKAVFDMEHVISLASSQLAIGIFRPRTVPYDGIQTGEIEAIRCWSINRDQHSAWLESCFVPVIWEPDQVQTGDPSQPGEGVHAWKRMGEAKDYVMTLFGGGSNVWGVVYGTVKLWGEVIEHEYGYRAQFAKIVSLFGIHMLSFNHPSDEPYLSYFRQLYGVS